MEKNENLTLGRIFGVLISVGILIFICWRIPCARIVNIIRHADAGYLGIAVFVALLNHFLFSVDKFRRIISSTSHTLSFEKATIIKVGGSTLDVVLPFRLGDILKAKYLNIDKGLSMPYALGALVFDKALNLWAILVVLFVGFSFMPAHVPLVLPGVMLLMLVAVIWFNKLWDVACILFGKVHSRAGEILRQFGEAFFQGSFRRKASLCGYALLIQALEVSLFYFIFLSVGIKIPMAFILSGGALVVAVSVVPVAFLGIGVREAAVVTVFAAYAVPEILLSVGVLLTLIGHVMTRLLGLFFIPRFFAGISRGPLGRKIP